MSRPMKRRKTNVAVEEVNFDAAARQEYLTGFHKRKQQRIKKAQDEAARKEREFKIQHRKELREQREKDVKAHVENVNAMLRKAQDDESDSADNEGLLGDDIAGTYRNIESEEPVGHEAEYVDEDKYTTVTVEPMNMSESSEEGEEEEAEHVGGLRSNANGKSDHAPTAKNSQSGKKTWTKENPNGNKARKKRKKFRYESKGERKATRAKQKIKKSTAARTRRTAG